MRNVYGTLRNLDYFIDNKYLQKYSQLIERHTRTPSKPSQTHKHHILPKSWFKLTGNVINNDLNNLVNLPKREHVLAHYYLCLCTEDPFKYANQLALMCLQTHKTLNIVEKQLLYDLPMYNNIYEDFLQKRQKNYRLYEDVE